MIPIVNDFNRYRLYFFFFRYCAISLYTDENNGRYYIDERESTRATLDQNKEARHRPQEPARYNEPIGRSPDQDLVGTTHISSLSSSSYPNGASNGGHRDRELVSRRGAEEEEYHMVERDERHYRDQQQPPRRRSHHQSQQRYSRRPSSPDHGGYYDDGYGKRRHRQSSADYEHHRQDYGHRQSSSHGRGGQYHQERDGDFIDYVMEDDLDWANGRWEGRDMARLAAAVARQGRRWDAIREQIRIPVLVSVYDDQECGDIYEGFRFEPPVPSSSSSADRQYSRHHPHHSSSSTAQPQQRYIQSQPQQCHQRRTSYQQLPREDARKSSHKTHHRPLGSTTAPAREPADDNYSQRQMPSPLMSSSSSTSKRTSGAIASVSYSRGDMITSATSSSPYTSGGAASTEVVVLNSEDIEEREAVERGRGFADGEQLERVRPRQGEVVDVDSIEQGQGRREGEGLEEQVAIAMAETHGHIVVDDKEVVLVEREEESRSLEVELMEIDEEHQETEQEMATPNTMKASSEVDAEIMQSEPTSIATTSGTTTATTSTISTSRTTTEKDIEALAMH